MCKIGQLENPKMPGIIFKVVLRFIYYCTGETKVFKRQEYTPDRSHAPLIHTCIIGAKKQGFHHFWAKQVTEFDWTKFSSFSWTHHKPSGHTVFAALPRRWQPHTCTSLYRWPGRCGETALSLQTAPESGMETTRVGTNIRNVPEWVDSRAPHSKGSPCYEVRAPTSHDTSVWNENWWQPAGRARHWPRGCRLSARWGLVKEPPWPHTPVWQVHSPKLLRCHLGWRWLEELPQHNRKQGILHGPVYLNSEVISPNTGNIVTHWTPQDGGTSLQRQPCSRLHICIRQHQITEPVRSPASVHASVWSAPLHLSVVGHLCTKWSLHQI